MCARGHRRGGGRLVGPTHEFRGVKRWGHGRGVRFGAEGIEDSPRGKFTFTFTPENPFVGTVLVKTSDPYELDAQWTEGYEPEPEEPIEGEQHACSAEPLGLA